MKTLIAVFFSLILSLSLKAQVNIKNGNFYISYMDLSIKNSQFVFGSFLRTYNSKSTEIGLFGYGWGSQWETKLYHYPDGILTIHEYGAGGKTTFYSELATDENTQLMVGIIIDTQLENNLLENNPTAILQLQKNLINDMRKRHIEWKNLISKNLIEYDTEFIENIEYESYSKGNQKVKLTTLGFERLSISSQNVELFNLDGRLIKFTNKNGEFTKIEYVDAKINKMISSDGSVINFETNYKGNITEAIKGEDKAIYKYDGDDLIFSIDGQGYQYSFKYDQSHNLIQIVYNPVRLRGMPEDAMHITYEDKTNFCASVKQRDGELAEYEYLNFFKEDGTKDDMRYATKTITTDNSGDKVTNYYEYIIGINAFGKTYSQKTISKIRGIHTTTTYDELCNLPIEIIKGSQKTTFKYDNRCHLIEKKAADGTDIKMQYHPTLEKLTYVKNDEGEFKYEYDEKGNLTKGSKNDETHIVLTYDDKGKIMKMVSNKNTLLFGYNSIGKPIEINMKGQGKIKITYDNSGEIKSVKSKQGPVMSLKVTQAFQNLLSIVKPSGVNLNM